MESDAKCLHGRVELPAEHQQMLALTAALANAQQVVLTQLVDALAIIADLTDRAALLGRYIGNPDGCVGNGLDRPDDFIQRAVGRLRLLGGGFGVFDLGAHALHRLVRGGLQAGDQGLDLGGGARRAHRRCDGTAEWRRQ